jgi:DNA helicase HerA-like ATPase
MPQIASAFITNAFDYITEKVKLVAGSNEKARLCIIFEEAHSIIPEWNQVSEKKDTEHVNKTARIILQGRKYGLGSIIITQRTANVVKTILNQCNTILALQSFDQTGLDFLKNYMGDEYSNSISTLPLRHAILVGKASSSSRPVIFRIEDFEYKMDNTEQGVPLQ